MTGPADRRERRWAGAPLRRAAPLAAAAAGLAALTACLDLPLQDVAFPPDVPGLPADQPWVSMPVGVWLLEPGIQARAISACFSETCRVRAAVGLFRAEGADAARLSGLLDDPARIARALEGRAARPGRVAAIRAVVRVERRRESGLSGFAVGFARPDGSRSAVCLALGTRNGRGLVALVVVAETDEGARALAAAIAPHLGA